MIRFCLLAFLLGTAVSAAADTTSFQQLDLLPSVDLVERLRDFKLQGVNLSGKIDLQFYFNTQTQSYELLTSDRRVLSLCRKKANVLRQTLAADVDDPGSLDVAVTPVRMVCIDHGGFDNFACTLSW